LRVINPWDSGHELKKRENGVKGEKERRGLQGLINCEWQKKTPILLIKKKPLETGE